jgi:hypothetical protein
MVATGSANPHSFGILARTTDGGAKWQTEGGAPAVDLASVSCLTASDCFALGRVDNGTTDVAIVGATTDGGTTWTSESLPATPSLSQVNGNLSCLTASDCWVALYGGVEARADGGHSWAAEPLPHEVGSTQDITCVDPSSCWVLAVTATDVVILARHPPPAARSVVSAP